MIYQLQWESILSFANADDYAHLKTWKLPTPIEYWTAIPVALKVGAQQSDVMGLHSIMVWSTTVLDNLKPSIGDAIQALPIHLDADIYYAIHILKFLDCLDAEKSQFRRFKNRNIGVEAYVLEQTCIGDVPLFTIPDDGYSAVFVSDAIKQVIDHAGWTGVSFVEVSLS